MNLAVVGSRDYPHPEYVRNLVRAYHERYGSDLTIVSGAARGVDRVAAQEARALGAAVIEFPADWSQGNGAGYARNHQIIAAADRVYVFHDGRSRGSMHTLRLAVDAGKPCWVYGPQGKRTGRDYLAERGEAP